MPAASIPVNEEERLKVVRRSRLLDSAPERMFDAIVMRAAEICHVPISTITLIDEHRQWFKAKVGVTGTETDRNIAFCAHAILQNQLMVVPDASLDERFAENPLVTGEPNIRFYAGMPLITEDGVAFGTLCVIDREPRELTPEQVSQLKILAESARILLEMKITPMGEIFERALAASAEGFSVADARDPDLPLVFVNDAFCDLTGYTEEEVLGRNCRFLQGSGTDPSCVARIRETLQSKQPCVVELLNYTKTGTPFWNRLSMIPLTNESGELTYVVGLQSDITADKDAEAARQKMLALTATMNTVNDIVLNFMNNLKLYRVYMEETWKADPKTLQRFDFIFNDTTSKLSKINALTEFKSRTAAKGITVLDTE